MKSNFLLTKLMLLLCLLVGSVNGVWAADQTGTITFGTTYVRIDAASVTADDGLDNEWTITTVGTTSFTQQPTYSQVGASKKPATSITFTTTLAADQNITAFSAKFGGFSGTAGDVTLKVGDTTVGTGSLDETNDVTVSSSSSASGKVLTVTVTGISKGVKCYYISYTYTDGPVKTKIATIADIDDTQLDFNATGTFARPTITPATGAKEGVDYEVEWSSADANLLTVDVNTGEYLVGDTKGTVEVTLTVEPYDDAFYEAASKTFTVTIVDPNANDGSLAKPYTVAEARAAIDAGEGVTGVYAKGIVSEIVTAYNSLYGNISYNISADGLTTSDQLQAYRGKAKNGEDFTSADDIQVGDEVVVYGNLKKYNSIYEFAADNQLVSRSKRVQLAASGYASYCSPLPLDLTPTENYAAWAVTATNNTEVTFTKIQGAVPAATPFILYGEGMGGKTITLPVATGATTAVAGNMLKGTLEETSVSTVNGDYTNFGLSNGAFVKLNDGTIPANKAYLPILTANVPTAAARLTIVFDEGMATGIANINRESTDNRYFNLNGQQVKTPQKGMFIVNGKKVIIK